MDKAKLEGSPVAMMRRGVSPPSVHRGTVVTSRRTAVAVQAEPAAAWAPGEEVVLIVGEDDDRLMAPGRFVSTQSGMAVFALEAEWRPFEVKAERHPGPGIEAEVRSILGGSRQPATIVDVAGDGMAVMVATRPGGKDLEVQARASGYAAHLPCQVVSHAETDDGQVLLRLKFGVLTLPQQAFVRQLRAAMGAIDTAGPDSPSV
ncbi:MAG: hypothetical protein HY875_01775 [Chloroflexi bacterium]|nr:hypothetical protein [Chloroflexota bacterium]